MIQTETLSQKNVIEIQLGVSMGPDISCTAPLVLPNIFLSVVKAPFGRNCYEGTGNSMHAKTGSHFRG